METKEAVADCACKPDLERETSKLRSESRTVRRIDVRCVRKLQRGDAQFNFGCTSLDLHADTSCAGSNATVLELTGEKVTVYPFLDNLPAVKEVPIATVLTVWESPDTGEVWALIIHEALYFGDRLQGSLLCPNQLRAAGNQVHDVPTQFDSSSRHSIVVPTQLELPMELHGVISHLLTRRPTNDEIQRYQAGLLQSVELTANIPWEPYSPKFAEKEQAAKATASVAAVRVTIPRVHVVDDALGSERNAPYPQRPLISDERCLAIATRLARSNDLIEFSDSELATRLIAAINVESDCVGGDGLEYSDNPLCEVPDEDRRIAGLSTHDRGPVLTKEILSKRWGNGLDTAHRTITVTTQNGIRRILHPVERCCRTRQAHLRFPTLNTRLYTDTMFSAVSSLRGSKCAQVFTNGIGYDLFYPLKKEAMAADALNEVIRTVGVPKELVSDGARAELHGRFAKVANEYRIKRRVTEPYSGWQNRAEAAIREIKRGIRRAMQRARSPKRLWDYCGEWVLAIRRLTAHDITSLHDRVPCEVVEGNTPDISEYAQFDWYQYIWYHDPAVQFPEDAQKLGRWIGVAQDVGSPMTFWVLPASCRVIARSTVSQLSDDELLDPIVKNRMVELNLAIAEKIGNTIADDALDDALIGLYPEIPDNVFLPDEDGDHEPLDDDADAVPEADDYSPEAYDKYLTAEVLLPTMGNITKAKVTGRKRDADGNPIRKQNANPMLDTRESKSFSLTVQRMCLQQISSRKICIRRLTRRVTLFDHERDNRSQERWISCDQRRWLGNQGWATTTTANHEGMEIAHQQERRHFFLGFFERLKRIPPRPSCQIHASQ